MSLSKTLYLLLSTGSAQEIVDMFNVIYMVGTSSGLSFQNE